VRALRAAGEIVEVVAAGPAGGEWSPADGTVARIPSPIFGGAGAPEAIDAGGIRTWLDAAAFFARLKAEVRRRAPGWDRLESHWLVPCGLAAALAAPGRAHRAFAHSGDVALLEKLPLGRALARFLAGCGADIRFASADLRRRFALLAGREVGRVEPMPIDRELFVRPTAEAREILRRERGLDRPTVLSVGRLVPVKGIDVLVDAVAALARPVTVVVAGDGPLRSVLATRASARGVDLRLPGTVPQAEIAALMGAADVYVQPSRRLPDGRTEGMPVATLEALAVGLPVVASATGGLADLGPRAVLVPPEDPAALARALAAALPGFARQVRSDLR
jgi:glycosyltransferase involved in cell wall biosynthesis